MSEINHNCENENCEACKPYCNECGACGEVACDGILGFIVHHVRGKTNCKYEDVFLQQIVDNFNKVNSDFYED